MVNPFLSSWILESVPPFENYANLHLRRHSYISYNVTLIVGE